MRNEARAQYTAPKRLFVQHGVKLNTGADKVARGARQWNINAGEWYAKSGKVPADVYDLIDSGAKELAALVRDWANFLKGKGKRRVTDKLIFDATRRIENVMSLSHALNELGANPRFVDNNGRAFLRAYIAAKTARIPPFLLPPELIANAKRAGAAVYAEASGAAKATAVLKANSDGVAQWLKSGGVWAQPPGVRAQYIAPLQLENKYTPVPLFDG